MQVIDILYRALMYYCNCIIVYEFQRKLFDHDILRQYGCDEGSIKRCSVRMYSLPSTKELCKLSLGLLRSHEINTLVEVCGTVVRTGTVRMLELSKEYQCMNPKCGYRFTVTADEEQGFMIPQPRVCPGYRKGLETASEKNACGSVSIRVVEDSRDLIDYQEIRIQDQVTCSH